MSKSVKNNAKRSGKVERTYKLTQSQLAQIIASTSHAGPGVAPQTILVPAQTETVSQPEAKVETPKPQPKATDAMAAVRAAKARKDAMIKRLKDAGVIPQDAVLNSQGLNILEGILKLSGAKGCPILGIQGLMPGFKTGSLEDRVQVLEYALSQILPLAVSRPSLKVKVDGEGRIKRRGGARVVSQPEAQDRVETVSAETETEAKTGFWASLLGM